MVPPSTPVNMALTSAPAQWWEVLGALGPLAVLLGAIVAAVISGVTLGQRSRADALALAQKRRADDRSEWWRRTQWALDRALDVRPSTKALGLATLEVLAHSTLAHAEDLKLYDVAWASVTNPGKGEAGLTESQDMNPQERLVQVSAARLRLTLDGRLGRETPDEVKALANEPI